jgi:peptidoglycan hydrolase-like protein with peptidoglycan-binding domain
MKKIIKLTESDLYEIVKNVLKEQRALPTLERGSKGEEVRKFQKALLNLGYNLGSTGADGVFGPRTERVVKSYQASNKLEQTGKIDQATRNLLGLELGKKALGVTKQFFGTKKPQDGKITEPTKKLTQKPGTKKVQNTKLSSQVNRQIDYMRKNGILSNERFTILDDKNNQVHAFNPNYELYKTYFVITGKDVGDSLKTQSMTDWVAENWMDVGAKFFSSVWERTKNFATTGTVKNNTAFQDVADYVDNCYFNQEQWRIKNTPSGVFKRAGLVQNFMNDWLATTFVAQDYGNRFITWETCGGETIPFGFHGTKSDTRLNVLPGGKDFSKTQCKRRQMSFGCVNFADADVKDISSFITSGQISIWLPDATDDIVEIPSTCAAGSGPQKSIMSYDYMTQKYGKGFK